MNLWRAKQRSRPREMAHHPKAAAMLHFLKNWHRAEQLNAQAKQSTNLLTSRLINFVTIAFTAPSSLRSQVHLAVLLRSGTGLEDS